MDQKAKLDAGGRIVVPREYRKALGLHPGDDVMIACDSDGVHIRSARGQVKKAQAILRRYVRAGERLSDELIADRRAESRRE